MVGKDQIDSKERLKFNDQHPHLFENIVYASLTFIIFLLIIILLTGGMQNG